MSKDNDTITIKQKEAYIESWSNNTVMHKGSPVLNHANFITEKPTGELVLPNLNNANIDNASSTIALSDNTPIEGILLVRGNITTTEITKISDAVVCKTISITNENNDSSQILGENVVEDTTE